MPRAWHIATLNEHRVCCHLCGQLTEREMAGTGRGGRGFPFKCGRSLVRCPGSPTSQPLKPSSPRFPGGTVKACPMARACLPAPVGRPSACCLLISEVETLTEAMSGLGTRSYEDMYTEETPAACSAGAVLRVLGSWLRSATTRVWRVRVGASGMWKCS